MNNLDSLQKKSTRDWAALQKSDEPVLYLGMASCGKAAGADNVKKVIEETLKKNRIKAQLVEVGCIGTCYLEPIVDIMAPGKPRISYGNVDAKRAEFIIQKHLMEGDVSRGKPLGYIGSESYNGIPSLYDQPMLKPQVRIVTRNCGLIDPGKISHYIANDGYTGLSKALKMKPGEVVEEITRAGLRGRGGAGFQTGRKWKTCHDAKADRKYLICNADEGDPGAFMNRLLIESDPHALLEGMLIAAYAIGATQGYIYIRAEYPLAIVRLKTAIKQMR